MITARLLAVEPLNQTSQRLLLDAPDFAFSAGQYLEVVVGGRRGRGSARDGDAVQRDREDHVENERHDRCPREGIADAATEIV